MTVVTYAIMESLKGAIEKADQSDYYAGCKSCLVVQEDGDRIIVSVTDQPPGVRVPETLTFCAWGMVGTWRVCPMCLTYASSVERGMHFSIMGQFPMGCHDCRPRNEYMAIASAVDGQKLVKRPSDEKRLL